MEDISPPSAKIIRYSLKVPFWSPDRSRRRGRCCRRLRGRGTRAWSRSPSRSTRIWIGCRSRCGRNWPRWMGVFDICFLFIDVYTLASLWFLEVLRDCPERLDCCPEPLATWLEPLDSCPARLDCWPEPLDCWPEPLDNWPEPPATWPAPLDRCTAALYTSTEPPVK